MILRFIERKRVALLGLVLLGGGSFLTGCGGGGSDGNSGTTPPVRSDSRPNIIFIYTDDHGYADLGAQGVVSDVRTPHLDKMAANGVRMTHGYVTAPQCTPSRAALMTGRYQQKFGVDDNTWGPMPLEQPLLAEKLAATGYKTGMIGKWHLEVNAQSGNWYKEVYAPGSSVAFSETNIPVAEKLKYYPENRGFQDNFMGYITNFRANFNLNGETIPVQNIRDNRFRVDVASDAAVAFINRHKTDPFFLYVAYYAPHVPLEATEKYLSRFPTNMPQRRRYALAMLAAIDDGVGRIMSTLDANQLTKDTLIFFMGDNGAPLALTKEDVLPVSTNGSQWDGSLNDPLLGEKGMLSDGGIRVPFLMQWKGHVPEGLVYQEPVIAMDASATAAKLAGLDTTDMDGIHLIPYLNDTTVKPDRALYWRFLNQAAMRKGKWKYLRAADSGEYLFDMSTPEAESVNLVSAHPAVASAMHQELAGWSATLKRPGLPTGVLPMPDKHFYDYYFPASSQGSP